MYLLINGMKFKLLTGNACIELDEMVCRMKIIKIITGLELRIRRRRRLDFRTGKLAPSFLTPCPPRQICLKVAGGNAPSSLFSQVRFIRPPNGYFMPEQYLNIIM